MLGRFVRVSPKYRRWLEAGFADRAPFEFRLGLPQGVFEGRRGGVPTWAGSGKEGDWDARIAD